ncbi:6437_t:CDS:2, partial [Ambispora leptoticha]
MALLQLTRAQNAPQTENIPPPAPEGDLISFDENPPTHQPSEATSFMMEKENETSLAPLKSEKISEQENTWINLATTGALVFTEKYDGEANQYDVNSMYVYEMIKYEASQ